MEFIQAKGFTKGRAGAISLIVIHTMEAHERNDTAENVARWFAGPSAPRASAHYCIDNDSVVQCVLDGDTAWHASQVNDRSIGLEHAGFAKQSEAEWADDYSTALLIRSAALAARLCLTYGIPVCRLTPEQVKAGAAGFCGHVDVNTGYGNAGGHVDPGPHFPWSFYLEQVGAEMDRLGREEMAQDSEDK